MRLDSLEQQVVSTWRADRDRSAPPPVADPDQPAAWVPFLLHFALLAARLIRTARLGDLEGYATIKGDGSPVTGLERLIEDRIAGELRRAGVAVGFIAEESANGPSDRGLTLAVDPVDGTWSLVNRTETAATSLALLRDGHPIVGVVANPATAEIAYAVEGGPPRLLQLGAFGEDDRAVDLPIPAAGPDGLLVSIHPQRKAGPILSELSRAWHDGEIDMVRSPGGAPSLGLLEVAKGSFVYVNLWDRRETAPWDLSAGMLLVRSAGGDVVDLAAQPIPTVGHRGPIVAALDAGDRERVVVLVRQALGQGPS